MNDFNSDQCKKKGNEEIKTFLFSFINVGQQYTWNGGYTSCDEGNWFSIPLNWIALTNMVSIGPVCSLRRMTTVCVILGATPYTL